MISKRIPSLFIDDLLSRTDIVDVIQQIPLSLKKRGANYLACCPFHDEKTASFTVSPVKQIYHCFGCGAGGNVISFIMNYEKLEFVETIELLAGRLGLKIPYEHSDIPDPSATQSRQKQFDLLERTALFYQNILWKTLEGKNALNYLYQRGFKEETIRQFELGFAPSSNQALFKALGNDSEKYQLLEKTGVLVHFDNRYNQRYYQRIIFPIRNRRGQVVGFGGRALDSNEKSKYINSPETELFHKSFELYHLFQARKTLHHAADLFVVEGYMDVIALVQAGITATVATLGTAVTPHHLRELLKLTREKALVFCFDGDNAGRKAAWGALEHLLPFVQDGIMVDFMFLPEGEDPDSLTQKGGKSAFLKIREQALPLSTFLLTSLNQKFPTQTAEEKSRFHKNAKSLLDKLPESTFKQLIIQAITDTIGINFTASPPTITTKPKIPKPQHSSNQPLSLVLRAASLLIQKPTLITDILDFALENSPTMDAYLKQIVEIDGEWKLWFKLIEFLKNHRIISTAQLLEHWREMPEYGQLQKLASINWIVALDKKVNEFKEIQHTLKKQLIKNYSQTLIEKSRTGELSEKEKYDLQKLQLYPQIT